MIGLPAGPLLASILHRVVQLAMADHTSKPAPIHGDEQAPLVGPNLVFQNFGDH
jgi:hypothetical protein